MKKTLKVIVRCILFICVLAVVLGKTASVVGRKESYSKYADYYDRPEEFDVLFFGTSHVLRGVFPMELWNDYGIVSYNMSNNAETLAESYWVLRNTLDYSSPELVVIDLYKISMNEKIGRDEETGELFKEYLHDYMDALPMSWTKLQAIWDLLPPGDRMEFLFDFSLYHERWSLLGKEDFDPVKSPEKGAEGYAEIVSTTGPVELATDVRNEENTLGKYYLEKMIELCQKKGIEVLLTCIPYGGITEEDREWINSGYTIAEKYGISYANMLEEEELINYSIDCSDSNSHLNVSGGRKVTEYLGAYMTEHYEIPDRRNQKNCAEWFADYQNYMEEKLHLLSAEADIYKYLLLLNDQSMSCCCYIRAGSRIYDDQLAIELLHNTGSDKRLEEARIKNEDYLVLFDNYTGQVYEFVGDETFERNVQFGLFEYDTDENGEKQLHIEFSKDNYLTDSTERPSDLHVLVFNNANGEMVDKARFIMAESMTRKEIKMQAD
ncbi:MAG: hypothetical protein HFI16_10955 [Lachnospiraceae bacterium]|nr:hypothetical protein [Lachnospiraceae bacterium]